jgi:hypothetical protein
MRRLLTGVVFLLGAAEAQAEVGAFELRAAVLNESRSLPSPERLFTQLNPGVEAGIGWTWRRWGRLALVQHAVAGVWHHPGFATSGVARTTVGLRVRPVAALDLAAGLSVGYLAQRSMAPLFRRVGEGFEVGSPWLHRFLGGVSLEVAYGFGRVAAFVAYSLFVEAPFLAKFSPVLPHQTLQVGVRIALGAEGVR